MTKRKQVLIVTNSITDEEVSQIHQAFKSSAAPKGVSLSLVHVVPRLPSISYFNFKNTPAIGTLIETYYDEARRCLHKVGEHLGVNKKNQWLISGKIRTEVLRLANKLDSSFILASSEQIKELRTLFFRNIHQYALIKNIAQLKE